MPYFLVNQLLKLIEFIKFLIQQFNCPDIIYLTQLY